MKIDDNLLKKSINAAIEHSVIKKEGFKDKVRKFDESIDLIINLKDLNLNDPKQRIDKEIVLPNNTITSDKPNVCVIASDEILLEARKIGLETIDTDGLVQLNNEEKKVKKKFVKKYDFFIVEDKMMPSVARYLARFLGPLGKVAIERYLKIIRIQLKKQLLIQVKIGKKSMEEERVFENLKAVVDYIADQMPHKYNNIKSMFLKTTMGHPIKVDEQFLKSIEV
ncbi:MAG: hypothetical protein ACTSQU_09255 [Promethearchaeota archaeon]